jgi:DNA/RNA-binding domain of Phe-tRNA-synthetase-like protein
VPAKKKPAQHKPAREQPEPLPEEWEVVPEPGWVDPALAEEFPGLSILVTTLGVGSGRSPQALKERLRTLSDRFGGAQAVTLRQRPIPWAYRVFFRHIGLDPDQTRTPIEQLALDRMKGGRFQSQNRLDDALTIAMVEVGVALMAFDADRVEGLLGLRLSLAGEGFEGRHSPLPEGTIVIADERRALAVLFDRIAEGRGVHSRTERTALVAIGVRGVPGVALEEGLWVAASAMHA